MCTTQPYYEIALHHTILCIFSLSCRIIVEKKIFTITFGIVYDVSHRHTMRSYQTKVLHIFEITDNTIREGKEELLFERTIIAKLLTDKTIFFRLLSTNI